MRQILCLFAFLLSGCTMYKSVPVAITDDIPEMTIIDGNIDSNNTSNYSTKKIAWGIGPDVNDLKQPVDCIKAQTDYQNLNTYFLISDETELLLTFDNGYENGNTHSILDTLKKHDIQAIFFITSQYAIENPELVQRMIDEGHMIGNHSWHHYSMPECTDDILVNEIMDLHNYMIEHFQYQMTTLRPPKGEFSEKTLAITQDLGYKTIMWSYAYYDYDVNNQPDEATAHQKLIHHLHPGEILLLHAVSDTNMMILDEFIDDTLSQGYVFVKPEEKMG